MADLDDEVDALYGLPLDAFVPERDALAKRLRADKRREDADAVKALRKPSVAAWAANQVLRSQPGQRDALLTAEADAVNHDIDAMWDLLAKESKQTREQIDEVCHSIDLKVAMRTRWVQYKRYQKAGKEREGKEDEEELLDHARNVRRRVDHPAARR